MTALTITAVDTGANTLTITGHGLVTGDGPAAVRNIGGALPAATPALGPLLDRFVIRVDANTLKLAASSADALAGTPIDITSSGSGTNLLEIGVPFRRPRTYAPGVQLKSADLNANFDSWIAVHGLLTGQTQGVWTGVSLAGPLTVGGLITANAGVTAGANQDVTVSGTGKLKHGTVTRSLSGNYAVPAAGAAAPSYGESGGPTFTNVPKIIVPIPDVPVGSRVLEVRCKILDSAGTTYQLKFTDTGGASANGNTSAGDGSLQTLTVGSLNHTVGSGIGMNVVLTRTGGTGTFQVTVLDIDVDQP